MTAHQFHRLLLRIAVLAAVGISWPAPVRAEHAEIDLQVIGPDSTARATVDEEPPIGGHLETPVLTVNAEDPLTLQFVFTNIYPHAVYTDAAVRYFVVRIDELRQKQLPPLDSGVVTEGRVVLDFKPKGRVGARLQFRLPSPGFYRVRVDSQNTKSEHEHFAAIDLKAE